MPHDDVLTLVRNANPLPDLERFDTDEAAAGVAAIEAAWQLERTGPAPLPTPVQAPRRTLRYALVFAAAALMALILIGAPMLLRQPGDAPVVEEPTTTMPTTVTTTPPATTTSVATTTTTDTTLPLIPMPALDFTRGATTEFENSWVGAITVAESGMVVVGGIVACDTSTADMTCNADGAVWLSTGGQPWERVGDPKLFAGPDDTPLDGTQQNINDVTNGALGLFAVGEDNFDGAVWASSDGVEWSRVTAPDEFGGNDAQWLNAVVYGGPGLVAVGRDGMNAGVWVSEDGVTWIRADDPDLVGDGEPVVMDALAAGPNGFVAVGQAGFESDMAGGGTGTRPAMWVSTDGLDWERLPDGALETFGVREVASLRGGDEDFLLIGDPLDDSGEGVWTSPDGHSWERIDVPYMGPSDEPGSVDHIGTFWDGSRWVSVGVDHTSGSVWASFEIGVPWQPVGSLDADLFAEGFEITNAIATDDGLRLVVGRVTRDEPTQVVDWTGTWDG
ncbi:MAG: hypothetical protein ABFS21_12395 [Actinomycetota bacterium]